MLSFDEALQRAGEFGRFQRRVFLLLCLTGVTFAFLFVAVVFLGSRPERVWCRGPGAAALAARCGWSAEEEWNRTAPERAGRAACRRFLLEAANASAALSCADPLAAFPNRSAPLVPCRGGWRYAQARSTVVSQVGARRPAPPRAAPGSHLLARARRGASVVAARGARSERFPASERARGGNQGFGVRAKRGVRG